MGRPKEKRAGKKPKGLHKTESAGQTAWRPYAPTGVMRDDDDDDDDVMMMMILS